MRSVSLLVVAALAASAAAADPAEILSAEARKSGDGWTVSVTLAHGDTGWDDYADGWRVETAEGAVLGTRTLFHPHVEEQPFTRSLSGVAIPDGTTEVEVHLMYQTTSREYVEFLADEINVGYEHLYNDAVVEVNGHKPRDMVEFVRRVESNGGDIVITPPDLPE